MNHNEKSQVRQIDWVFGIKELTIALKHLIIVYGQNRIIISQLNNHKSCITIILCQISF